MSSREPAAKQHILNASKTSGTFFPGGLNTSATAACRDDNFLRLYLPRRFAMFSCEYKASKELSWNRNRALHRHWAPLPVNSLKSALIRPVSAIGSAVRMTSRAESGSSRLCSLASNWHRAPQEEKFTISHGGNPAHYIYGYDRQNTTNDCADLTGLSCPFYAPIFQL